MGNLGVSWRVGIIGSPGEPGDDQQRGLDGANDNPGSPGECVCW